MNMSTIRTTITAAFAVAVISSGTLLAATTSSQAGGYHGGYKGGYGGGYNSGYHHNYNYQYVYQPRCFWTKVKVWDYHGWHWEKVKVCN
jgi:hypothetical protein